MYIESTVTEYVLRRLDIFSYEISRHVRSSLGLMINRGNQIPFYKHMLYNMYRAYILDFPPGNNSVNVDPDDLFRDFYPF